MKIQFPRLWGSRRANSGGGSSDGPASLDDAKDLLSPDEFAALLRGERDAVHSFCVRVGPILRGRVRWVLSTYRREGLHQEEDLIQDLMVALLKEDMKELRKWDRSRGTLRGYLRLFADHRVRDILRGNLTASTKTGQLDDVKQGELSDGAESPSLRLERDEFILKTKALFEVRASEDQKTLFRRCYVEGEKPEALAAEEGVPANTIHQRLARLRGLLREIADDLQDSKRNRDS